MTHAEIGNWLAVYAATGVYCTYAMVLSISTIGLELYRERAWQSIDGVRSAAVLIPRIWWRWQKRYLLSTPVTLAIVGAFALTLDWTA